MANLTTLGNLHGRLCGELAAALARRVTVRQDWTPAEAPPPGAKGALFHHDFQTAFVDATEALTKFGLLTPLPRGGKPGTWHGPHMLTTDADEIPDFLADSVLDDDDRLPGLLEAFLAVFCEYDYLPDRHTPFKPPDYLGAAMNMLARNGYAERRGDQFVWTEQIRPAM